MKYIGDCAVKLIEFRWYKFFCRLSLDVVVILLIPNLAFILFSAHFSLERPLINLDYLICALFFLMGFRKSGLVVLFVSIFFDVLFLLGQVMPILRPGDIFYLLGFLNIAPFTYQLMFIGFLGLVALIACVFWKFGSLSFNSATVVLVNFVVIVYLVTVLQPVEASNRIWRVQNARVIDSLINENFHLRNMAFVKSFSEESGPLVPAEFSGRAQNWLHEPDSVPEKAILIIAESWGVSENAEINKVLLAPLKELVALNDNIEQGELNFIGLTIAAELRELCGLAAPNFNLGSLDEGFEGCLPNILVEKGYKTVGVHGAVGLMYDRAFWYPKAGFEEILFFENKEWERRCYSFPGACDIEIMTHIEEYFADSSKVFLYWLTLNSHAFYDSRDIVIDVFPCEDYDVPGDTQTCRNMKLHAQFFYELSVILKSNAFDGAEVIIVGDHVPPIIDREEKNRFFVPGKIPWVQFKLGG